MIDEKTCPLRMFAYTLTSRIEEMPCIRERCAWWCNGVDRFQHTLSDAEKGGKGYTVREEYTDPGCAIKILAVHTTFDRLMRTL